VNALERRFLPYQPGKIVALSLPAAVDRQSGVSSQKMKIYRVNSRTSGGCKNLTLFASHCILVDGLFRVETVLSLPLQAI
jgi:hypothetical protein